MSSEFDRGAWEAAKAEALKDVLANRKDRPAIEPGKFRDWLDTIGKKETKMKFKPVGEIKLGDVAKDVITGFEGKVVGITDWLYQCRRLGLQPMKLDKGGKPYGIEWVDELQCELILAAEAEALGKDKGGPMPAPTRNSDPR